MRRLEFRRRQGGAEWHWLLTLNTAAPFMLGDFDFARHMLGVIKDYFFVGGLGDHGELQIPLLFYFKK